MAVGPLTAQAVADLVGGRLLGNAEGHLIGAAPLDVAGPGEISFLASPRYLEQFRDSHAGCVLLPAGLAEAPGLPATRVVVDDPHRAIAMILAHLHPSPTPARGVHPTAQIGTGTTLGHEVNIAAGVSIGTGCQVGDGVHLGPGVVLEDGVVIGAGTALGSRVVCHHHVVLGARVTIKAGSVIGGVGFGYLSSEAGHTRIPHVGGCRIGDDVDIGANCCIDRGSLGETVVGRGTKLDNLVHIAHNVRIGEDCLIMALVAVAGSTRIGNRVVLSGQVGVIGHITLGDDVRVGAQGGVTGSVPAGMVVSGFPARPHREFMRATSAMYRLAPLARRLERLAGDPQGDA